jgi:phospholipid-binding lipoprotein MlaA
MSDKDCRTRPGALRINMLLLFGLWLGVLSWGVSPASCSDSLAAGIGTGDEASPLLLAQAVQPERKPQDKPVDEYGDVNAEQTNQIEPLNIADPIEPWNRLMYHFNDKFYFWLVKPVTQGYKVVVPQDFRGLIGNAFDNIAAPVRIVNNLLQLKVGRAGTELARFIVNSTVGVGGLRDCAGGCFGIKQHDEDLGQTFGYYGLGHGFYIVWPVIGPSSARDSVGRFGDMWLRPLNYIRPLEAWAAVWSEEKVNDLSFRIGDYEALKGAAVDPYVAMRDAYQQYRKKAVDE